MANIYLHVLDQYWTLECTHLGKLIRYCDDFVIVCRTERQAKQSLNAVRTILDKLLFELHSEKTRVVDPVQACFDFLGFSFRKWKSPKSGKLSPYTWPGKKAIKHIRKMIKELTAVKWLRILLQDIVRRLANVIVGWRNYFAFGNGTRQFQSLDNYVRLRLLHIYCRKMGPRANGVRKHFEDWLRGSKIEPFYRKGIFGQTL